MSHYSAQNARPKVYTDGACENNGKPNARAGIGVYWGKNDKRNLSEPLEGRQTSQRAEIRAAVRALEQAREQQFVELTIFTDSHYLIHGVTDWKPIWLRNGWINANGEPVENRKDFEDFYAAEVGIRVFMEHVEAHSGDEGNDAADLLARQGIEKHSDLSRYSAQNARPKVYTVGASNHEGKWHTESKCGIGVYWGPNDNRNVSEVLEGEQNKNRAEIRAALRAIEQARVQRFDEITIVTDSRYLFNSVTVWMEDWLRNGWKVVSGGQNVGHRQDFEDFNAASVGIRVHMEYVKAHSGDVGNDAADHLAEEGIKKHPDARKPCGFRDYLFCGFNSDDDGLTTVHWC